MNAHAHHYRVDPPNGSETVPGRCVECGAERAFRVNPPQAKTWIEERDYRWWIRHTKTSGRIRP